MLTINWSISLQGHKDGKRQRVFVESKEKLVDILKYEDSVETIFTTSQRMIKDLIDEKHLTNKKFDVIYQFGCGNSCRVKTSIDEIDERVGDSKINVSRQSNLKLFDNNYNIRKEIN